MGKLFSRLLRPFFSNCGSGRILMLGLDGAGKTTILFALKRGGETADTLPTIGFNVETVKIKSLEFTVWDVGGQDNIRPLWRHYFQNTTGIIFAIDCGDRDRFALARQELHSLLREEELLHATLLVLANKQDLPNAMSPAEVRDQLNIDSLPGSSRQRQWHVEGTCARTKLGLLEGMGWLATAIVDGQRQ